MIRKGYRDTVVRGSTLQRFLTRKVVMLESDTVERLCALSAPMYALRRVTSGWHLTFENSRYVYTVRTIKLAKILMLLFFYEGNEMLKQSARGYQ